MIGEFGGRDRDRTCDLVVANDALSQLSYTPTAVHILANTRGAAKPVRRIRFRNVDGFEGASAIERVAFACYFVSRWPATTKLQSIKLPFGASAAFGAITTVLPGSV
jgi:hypothetical protein